MNHNQSKQPVAGWINRFLSWEGFQPLSKLTYIIYLVHISVINVLIGHQTYVVTISHELTVSLKPRIFKKLDVLFNYYSFTGNLHFCHFDLFYNYLSIPLCLYRNALVKFCKMHVCFIVAEVKEEVKTKFYDEPSIFFLNVPYD